MEERLTNPQYVYLDPFLAEISDKDAHLEVELRCGHFVEERFVSDVDIAVFHALCRLLSETSLTHEQSHTKEVCYQLPNARQLRFVEILTDQHGSFPKHCELKATLYRVDLRASHMRLSIAKELPIVRRRDAASLLAASQYRRTVRSKRRHSFSADSFRWDLTTVRSSATSEAKHQIEIEISRSVTRRQIMDMIAHVSTTMKRVRLALVERPATLSSALEQMTKSSAMDSGEVGGGAVRAQRARPTPLGTHANPHSSETVAELICYDAQNMVDPVPLVWRMVTGDARHATENISHLFKRWLPQPIDLSRHLVANELASGRFAVSPKADGVRALLLVVEGGGAPAPNGRSETEAYMIAANRFVMPVECHRHLRGVSLFECEWIDGCKLLLLYDVLFAEGDDLRALTFARRRERLRSYMDAVAGSNHTRYTILEKETFLNDDTVPGGHTRSSANEPCATSGRLSDGNRLSPIMRAYQTTQTCNYPTDGLIFSAEDDSYQRQTFGRFYKWKPADRLSIDFEVSVYSDRDGTLVPLVVDRAGARIPFVGTAKHRYDGCAFIDPQQFVVENTQIWEFFWQQGRFVGTRRRTDKTAPNFVEVAGNIWMLMTTPLAIDDILYADLMAVRRLQNHIKRTLLETFGSQHGSSLLDIGSGRGADVEKWRRIGYEKIFAVDPFDATDNGVALRAELQRRIEETFGSSGPPNFIRGAPPAVIVPYEIGNLTALLRAGVRTVHTAAAFNVLPFLFASRQTFRDAMHSIVTLLLPADYTERRTGRLLVFSMDGASVAQKLSKNAVWSLGSAVHIERIDKTARDILSCESGASGDLPADDIFGQEIRITIGGTIVQQQTEYLVDFAALSATLEELHCKPLLHFQLSQDAIRTSGLTDLIRPALFRRLTPAQREFLSMFTLAVFEHRPHFLHSLPADAPQEPLRMCFFCGNKQLVRRSTSWCPVGSCLLGAILQCVFAHDDNNDSIDQLCPSVRPLGAGGSAAYIRSSGQSPLADKIRSNFVRGCPRDIRQSRQTVLPPISFHDDPNAFVLNWRRELATMLRTQPPASLETIIVDQESGSLEQLADDFADETCFLDQRHFQVLADVLQLQIWILNDRMNGVQPLAVSPTMLQYPHAIVVLLLSHAEHFESVGLCSSDMSGRQNRLPAPERTQFYFSANDEWIQTIRMLAYR
jgi:hypothetical protein